MLEEYKAILEYLFNLLDAQLSLPFSLRNPDKIECIRGMIEDVSYAIGCLADNDKVGYRPRKSTTASRPAQYRADV